MRKPSRTILDLREWIGATQEEMGDLLGMGRSAIALCERGHRDLPKKKRAEYLRLCHWMAAEQKALNAGAGFSPQHSAPSIALCKRLLKVHTHRKRQWEFVLREAEARCADTERWLSRLKSFPATTGLQQSCLSRIRRRHEAALSSYGPDAQLELKLRIADHEARIAVLTELLKAAGDRQYR
jgi:DNA-binding XRE family transcriptional regulator